jgi:hypothetical protein
MGLTNEGLVMVEEAQARLAKRLVKVDRASEVEAWGLLGRAQLRRGEYGPARANADAIVDAYGSVRPAIYYAQHTYAAAAEIHLALWELSAGRTEPWADGIAAAAARSVAMCWAFGKVFPIGLPAAWLLQGTYDWLRGREGRAMRAFERSLSEADRLAMPHEIGLAHLEIGRRMAKGAERGVRLGLAIQNFDRLGARYDLTRARDANRGQGMLPGS